MAEASCGENIRRMKVLEPDGVMGQGEVEKCAYLLARSRSSRVSTLSFESLTSSSSKQAIILGIVIHACVPVGRSTEDCSTGSSTEFLIIFLSGT